MAPSSHDLRALAAQNGGVSTEFIAGDGDPERLARLQLEYPAPEGMPLDLTTEGGERGVPAAVEPFFRHPLPET